MEVDVLTTRDFERDGDDSVGGSEDDSAVDLCLHEVEDGGRGECEASNWSGDRCGTWGTAISTEFERDDCETHPL